MKSYQNKNAYNKLQNINSFNKIVNNDIKK